MGRLALVYSPQPEYCRADRIDVCQNQLVNLGSNPSPGSNFLLCRGSSAEERPTKSNLVH